MLSSKLPFRQWGNCIMQPGKMPSRPAAAAGSFYSGNGIALRRDIERYMKAGHDLLLRRAACLAERFHQPQERPSASLSPSMVLLPHAGYMYSGAAACAALDGITLPERLIILGPTHTGRGRNFGIWPGGTWQTPLGELPVDLPLLHELTGRGVFAPDVQCHLGEHAIEVLLPFLRTVAPACSILPVTVAFPQNPEVLVQAARVLGELLLAHTDADGLCDVGLIISSDMNHFANEEKTQELDEAALRCVLDMDAEALLRVVADRHISMCGVLPAAVGLMACRVAGISHAHLCAHETSAEVSGNYQRVVGYASLLFW